MRVQFRCCLCGQVNTVNVDPDDARRAKSPGLFARLFGARKSGAASSRYTVECEFCRQNNSISSSRPDRPPA